MRVQAWIAIMLATVLLGGCASRAFNSTIGKIAPRAMADEAARARSVGPKTSSVAQQRKVIRNAGMTLAVDDLDVAGEAIVSLAESSGGFVLSSSRTTYTIKVPSTGFEPALSALAELGDVKHKSLSGEDVTAEYLDLEVRLKNAHAARDAYEALLARATSVEEILKVEQALNETQERIELLEGRRTFLDENLALSTIRISLTERRRPGPLKLLYDGVRWLFMKLIWL